MNTRLVLGGLKSYLPLSSDRFKGTGGTIKATYCYSIWLRHLSLLSENLGRPFLPQHVVEIGPGDSIGVGLTALLSGAERYVGLDVVEHSSASTAQALLEELIELFRSRTPIPDDSAFPRMFPQLNSYRFPHDLFEGVDLDRHLAPSNVARLREEIAALGSAPQARLRYCAPWAPDSVEPGSADLVFSQVALQDMSHAPGRDDLAANIRAMVRWLRPGGIMSHQIDFSCPGGTPWNHHWAYHSTVWKVICGRRPYYVNRVPFSEYVTMFENAGCRIVGVQLIASKGLPRTHVAKQFSHLPDRDFETSGAYLLVAKL